MNDIKGWHFSITIPIEDKEKAIEQLREIEVLQKLISSCIPSYHIEDDISYGTGGD